MASTGTNPSKCRWVPECVPFQDCRVVTHSNRRYISLPSPVPFQAIFNGLEPGFAPSAKPTKDWLPRSLGQVPVLRLYRVFLACLQSLRGRGQRVVQPGTNTVIRSREYDRPADEFARLSNYCTIRLGDCNPIFPAFPSDVYLGRSRKTQQWRWRSRRAGSSRRRPVMQRARLCRSSALARHFISLSETTEGKTELACIYPTSLGESRSRKLSTHSSAGAPPGRCRSLLRGAVETADDAQAVGSRRR